MSTCNGQCYHSTAIWIYTGWSFLTFLIPKRPSNKKLIKSYVRWYQFLNLALDQLLVSKFLGLDQLPVLRGVHFLFNLIIFPFSPILFWIFPTSHFFLSFASLWEENYEFARAILNIGHRSKSLRKKITGREFERTSVTKFLQVILFKLPLV